MFSYKIEAKENQMWEEVHGWALPFTDGQTLDESLDSGTLNLSCVTRSKPYAPFTRIRISIYDGETAGGTPADVLQYVVDTDTVTCRRLTPSTNKLYDHSIALVELTKLLERDVCDSMTVTNYIAKEYGDELTQRVYPSVNFIRSNTSVSIRSEQEVTGAFYAPLVYAENSHEITVPIYVILYRMGAQIQNQYAYARIEITAPDGTVTIFAGQAEGETPGEYAAYDPNEFYPYNYPHLTYTIDQAGEYLIRIRLSREGFYYGTDFNVDYAFIVTASALITTEDWTITDVVERLLSAGITRRIGIDAQKYVFDSEQAERFADVLAPEFAFTRNTLFEALLTVGGYIHGIPRLVDENRSDGALTVRFDLLGEDSEYSGELAPLFENSAWDGNEYCGALDSTVENMENTIDLTQGAVVEPSADTFRAVNVAQGDFRISSSDDIVILTDRPIARVLKLEFYLDLSDGNPRTIDITPYVYESAEYQTLSGYTGSSYPYSKGYALEYTRGQKNIRGLTFVLDHLSSDTFATNYAIINILEATGEFDAKNYDDYIITFQFRVTYIPFVTARVVQKKPYLTHPADNILLYQQGGSAVENEYYGENLKGTILRVGNIESKKTYGFNKYADIPKAGQRIGRRYVALVDREFDKMRIKATVTTVANFNKLAEYLGLNSNYRLYDVSEKQSVERQVNYGESCVISERYITTEARTTLITVDGINAIQYEFNPGLRGDYQKVTAIQILGKSGRTETGGGSLGVTLGMAAGSYAVGNSLMFFVNMEDNYGAGYQSNEVPGEEYNAYRAQRLVPYSDSMGNISTIDIDLAASLEPSDDTATPENAFTYPEYDDVGLGTIYFSTKTINDDDTGAPLFISKDSREAISLMIQQHFQSDDQNIVLGRALAKYCPLVTTLTTENRGVLYFFTRHLNPIESIIDLTAGAVRATESYTTSDETPDGVTITLDRAFRLVLPANSTGNTVYAWGIVNPSTGELYLGQNYPDGLAAGETPASLYFNFLNNAELKQYMLDEYTLGTAE